MAVITKAVESPLHVVRGERKASALAVWQSIDRIFESILTLVNLHNFNRLTGRLMEEVGVQEVVQALDFPDSTRPRVLHQNVSPFSQAGLEDINQPAEDGVPSDALVHDVSLILRSFAGIEGLPS